ncbi:hypothetical protein JHK87_052986 [Glycine soja]|nr:hypothetical protein JHK87_052986 [Glycine soja]
MQQGPRPSSFERLKWGSVPKPKPSFKEPLELQLKPLPSNFKYVFPKPSSSLLIVISIGLHETEEQKLLHVLRYNKEALGRAFMTQRIWTPQFATTESTLKRSFHPNAPVFFLTSFPNQ